MKTVGSVQRHKLSTRNLPRSYSLAITRFLCGLVFEMNVLRMCLMRISNVLSLDWPPKKTFTRMWPLSLSQEVHWRRCWNKWWRILYYGVWLWTNLRNVTIRRRNIQWWWKSVHVIWIWTVFDCWFTKVRCGSWSWLQSESAINDDGGGNESGKRKSNRN